MRDVHAFLRDKLSPLGLPPDRERKIVDEWAAELQESYESLLADGLSDDQAWTELQRHLPDWDAVGAEFLDAEPALTRLAHVDRRDSAHPAVRVLASMVRSILGVGVVGDLRSSVRLLVKDRGFTATTLLTLAVCLGANAAIFTVVYSVLFRPLPVAHAERLVAMGDVYPTVTPNDILSNTAPSFFDRREALTTLDEQAMFAFWYDTIAMPDGVSEEIRGMRATPSLFRLTETAAAIGRTFLDAEGEIGAEHKIILSDGLWRRLYGGDPSVIGRDLRLGWTGQRYTIVGVMPPAFSFFDHTDGHARTPGEQTQFWIPLAFTPAQRADGARTRYGFYHVGRMRPGVTVQQVRQQIDALNAELFSRFPQFGLAELGMYTAVTPLQQALTRRVSGLLFLLWGGAACVLLIGAVNVANLALARWSTRAREMATRLALGASRLRVARQLILESAVLAVLGGLLSIVVGDWLLRALAVNELENIPNAARVEIDRLVVAAVLTIAALVGVLIGVVPAAGLRRLNLNLALAEGSRLGTHGRATRVFRHSLVVAQVACSLVLLIGSALLTVSFRNLLAVDAGFDARGVATATIFPPPSRYRDQQAVSALEDRVLAAVRAIPGVYAAGVTSNIALSGATSPATVSAEGHVPRKGDALLLPSIVSVTPGYFEAMTTALVRGRYFTDGDSERALRVVIVDERLANELWPNEDPLGKGLYRGSSDLYTVVGVVRSVRFESLSGQAESVGAAYFPHAQAPPLGRLRWIAIKSATDPSSVLRSVRSAVSAIDADLSLADVQTMTERTSRSLVSQRLAMGLAGMFGLVALLLSVLGIYGVLAYIVAQRTREIGIRVALGSTAWGIFRLVFVEGLTLVGAGVGLGLLGSLALGRALGSHVYGVTPTDPLVVGAAALGTGLIALLACVSPARRAMQVDPIDALGRQ